MPRQRLHPEYVRGNYTYDCQILGPVPQAVWETAHGMQALWNGLVERHDALIEPWDVETSRDVKIAGYEAFWREAYVYVRDEGERLGLSCWPKWHVYDTFRAAQRRWARHQSERPHVHHRGLQQILIPYRTQSGGISVGWLFEDTPHKHTALLPPSPGHHHHEGYVTVGGERVHFRLVLHRPMPEEAILKRVALLGTFEPALCTRIHNGWQWRVQCSIELPPPIPVDSVGRSAGLDLGWRVRQDGLRLAVVTDGTRAWEWMLPWDMANGNMRRRQAWAVVHGLQVETTGNWRQLWQWQATLDADLETCKQALQGLDHASWPAEAKAVWQGHVKMRAGGLRHIAYLLARAHVDIPELTEWLAKYTLSRRRFRGAQLRLLRQRKYLYRMLADWLARHFDVVSWEGDLDLKDMAETVTTQVALEQGKKYRHMAGLSVLRGYIREALAKRGRHLLDTPAANTTRTCNVVGCDGVIVPTAALELCCSNGHWEDTDVNAAMVLWQAIPRAMRSTSRVVPLVDREVLRRALHRLA